MDLTNRQKTLLKEIREAEASFKDRFDEEFGSYKAVHDAEDALKKAQEDLRVAKLNVELIKNKWDIRKYALAQLCADLAKEFRGLDGS